MLNIIKIKNIIEEIILKEKIDRSHLDNNGAIYYANGNDGTDFDFECNGRTCEFMVYWNNGWGAVKLEQREDKFEVFVYPEDDPYGGKHKEYSFDSPFDLEELCNYLQGTFDNNGIYDQIINNWVLKEKNCD